VPGLPHPSPPVGTAAPVVASPPAATPPHAGLVGRLVEVVAPLRARGDGTHELTLRVTSPDLGDVDLRIDCRDGVVDVRLRARDPAAGAVLEAALADLRAALAEAGIDAGRLDVGRDPQPGPGGDEPGRPARGRATTEVPSVATTVPTVDPHAGVDVLL
ncbi:MAG: flagellar hook-length control protein FliK, partial [Acidimicrobiia bacterium]